MANRTFSGSLQVALLIAAATSFAACERSQSAGFTLPEGDAVAGQQTFVDLGCGYCHTVQGVEGLRAGIEEPQRTVVLGGEKTRVYTYGELVTSIINPSHKISQKYLGDVVEDEGETLMPNYNDIMTVTEMTDLVTFLEQNYTLKPYERTYYNPYGPM